MKSFAQSFAWTVGLACLGLAATSADAAAPRAYVSTAGNDANVCSNPATPCRTFTGAIAQTTSGGEVIVLNSGTFGGGTITQAVTINAPAGVAALVATPITVNAGATDVVTLRGITFVAPVPGSDTALTYSNALVLNLENCVFHGWETGIFATATGTLNVVDTTLRDNEGGGIVVSPSVGSAHATIARSRFLKTNFAVRAASRATINIKDSLFSGNDGAGVFAQPDASIAHAEVNVENCSFSDNYYAVEAGDGGGGGSATIRLANSTVTNNLTGIAQYGNAQIISRVNNTIEGNGTNVFGTLGTYTAK
jgi:hypothetical protein